MFNSKEISQVIWPTDCSFPIHSIYGKFLNTYCSEIAPVGQHQNAPDRHVQFIENHSMYLDPRISSIHSVYWSKVPKHVCLWDRSIWSSSECNASYTQMDRELSNRSGSHNALDRSIQSIDSFQICLPLILLHINPFDRCRDVKVPRMQTNRLINGALRVLQTTWPWSIW